MNCYLVTGAPYDTLKETIGSADNEKDTGSLYDYGISYNQIELLKMVRQI
jgi:cystathionine beta-lyase family protein involved in aluminum resistance